MIDYLSACFRSRPLSVFALQNANVEAMKKIEMPIHPMLVTLTKNKTHTSAACDRYTIQVSRYVIQMRLTKSVPAYIPALSFAAIFLISLMVFVIGRMKARVKQSSPHSTKLINQPHSMVLNPREILSWAIASKSLPAVLGTLPCLPPPACGHLPQMRRQNEYRLPPIRRIWGRAGGGRSIALYRALPLARPFASLGS